MPSPIRVGVVGVGYLGNIHAKIYSNMDNVELVGSGVGVGVGVGVAVGVDVELAVGVAVGSAVAVGIAVGVAVAVAGGVAVGMAGAVAVAVGVAVPVRVGAGGRPRQGARRGSPSLPGTTLPCGAGPSARWSCRCRGAGRRCRTPECPGRTSRVIPPSSWRAWLR